VFIVTKNVPDVGFLINYYRGGRPIYYHRPHERWNITGGPLKFKFILRWKIQQSAQCFFTQGE